MFKITHRNVIYNRNINNRNIPFGSVVVGVVFGHVNLLLLFCVLSIAFCFVGLNHCTIIPIAMYVMHVMFICMQTDTITKN